MCTIEYHIVVGVYWYNDCPVAWDHLVSPVYLLFEVIQRVMYFAHVHRTDITITYVHSKDRMYQQGLHNSYKVL